MKCIKRYFFLGKGHTIRILEIKSFEFRIICALDSFKKISTSKTYSDTPFLFLFDLFLLFYIPQDFYRRNKKELFKWTMEFDFVC